MGLDIVDFMIEVEEEFDIQIPDGDLEHIRTVGDLRDYIGLKKLVQNSPACLSSEAFLELRRGLMSLAGVDRKSVRLDTSIEDLLPVRNRRQFWSRFQQHTKLHLPNLRRPEWLARSLRWASYSLTLVAFLVAYAKLFDPSAPLFLVLLLLPSSLLGIALAYAMTLPWATQISPQCATVRAMSTTLLDQNFLRFAEMKNLKVEPSVDIFVKLVDIVSEHFAIPPEEIHPESSFIEDLGIN